MYHILFIHSSIEGHLGCFQILAVMNNAPMNMVEQVPLIYDCVSFGCMSKVDIAGS